MFPEAEATGQQPNNTSASGASGQEEPQNPSNHNLPPSAALTDVEAKDFCALMCKFVHALGFGNLDKDLMDQHVFRLYPGLLSHHVDNIEAGTSASDDLIDHPPSPNTSSIHTQVYHTVEYVEVGKAMYDYMYTLLRSPSYQEKTQENMEGMINEFIRQFPRLLITPDDSVDLPLFNAILQDKPNVALRFLNLLEETKLANEALSWRNNDGHTALTFMPFVAYNDDVENLLKKMLDLGADPSMADRHGRTVIHYAVVKRRSKILEIICAHMQQNGKLETLYATFKQKDSETNDPLMLAALKVKQEQDAYDAGLRFPLTQQALDPLDMKEQEESSIYLLCFKTMIDYWSTCTMDPIPDPLKVFLEENNLMMLLHHVECMKHSKRVCIDNCVNYFSVF